LWRIVLGFPIPVIAFQLLCILLIFTEDTPKYLIFKKKYKKAKKSLKKVYKYKKKTMDIDAIIAYVESTISKETSNVSFINALFGKIYSYGTWVCVVLIIFHELSGINVIMLYSNTIFKEMNKNGGSISPR